MAKVSEYYPQILYTVLFIVCFVLFSSSYSDEMDLEILILFLLALVLPGIAITAHYAIKNIAHIEGFGPRINGFLWLFIPYFQSYIFILAAHVLVFLITIDVLNPLIQLFVLLLFNPIFIFILLLYVVNRIKTMVLRYFKW
ncbi:MAG: hypothetical protein FWH46_06795 [Methanimicrococcus sp.]|nr:hypothetical protein [Methanimicrococcus sp.]